MIHRHMNDSSIGGLTANPGDGMRLLQFLNNAVPLPPEHESPLEYEDSVPLHIPKPPPQPPQSKPKHHRAPDVFATAKDQRPVSARAKLPVQRAALETRPFSARPGVTLAPPWQQGAAAVLPERPGTAPEQLRPPAAAPAASERAAAVTARPPSAPPAAAAAAAAATAQVMSLSAEGSQSASPRAGEPWSPRTARGNEWQPITRPWSDWSVANTAYPRLQAKQTVGAATGAARCRYTVHAADSPRPRRFRPSTAPVRVQKPWGDAVYVPVYTTPPASTPSAAARKGALKGGGFGILSGGSDAQQQQAGGGSSSAAAGGGAGKVNLAAALGKAGGAKLSLKTIANLTKSLSGVQARARAKEQERTEAEREAHFESLRTALGTYIDYHQPWVPSTASAIEASMADELLRAIPPKKDRSPQHLRRTIDKLEVRAPLPLPRTHASPSPSLSPTRHPHAAHAPLLSPSLTQVRLEKTIAEESPRGRKASRKPYMRETSSRQVREERRAAAAAHDTSGHSSSVRHRSHSPRGKSNERERSNERAAAAGHGGSGGGHTPHPPATPHPPSLQQQGSRGGGSNKRLPRSASREGDAEETLEALPMPQAGGRRHRHRSAAAKLAAQVSSLDSAKEHTYGLMEALSSSCHLLKRSSLRTLIANILEDPELLPPGMEPEDGADEVAGGLEALLNDDKDAEPSYHY